jgi:aminoglycoside 6'-N-acetyltransferase I
MKENGHSAGVGTKQHRVGAVHFPGGESPTPMRIVDLNTADEQALHHAAQLLVDGFRDSWPNAWPNLDFALAEVREALEPGKICRAAFLGDGTLAGWIGGQPQYDGHVWELHPLVVAASLRGQGIGRALVMDFEQRVRERGGLTILLGTDDEDNRTSLSGVDLYDNLPRHIAEARNLADHPFTFYQKLGFVIVGLVPDANGRGKPDILMAKRV